MASSADSAIATRTFTSQEDCCIAGLSCVYKGAVSHGGDVQLFDSIGRAYGDLLTEMYSG